MYVSSIHSMIMRHYLSRCVCLLQVGSSVETAGWIELILSVGVSFDLSYVLDISGYLQKYRYFRLDGVRKVSLCTSIVDRCRFTTTVDRRQRPLCVQRDRHDA